MAYVRPPVRERILELAARPEGVTSRELEADCRISFCSAKRYLHELEQRGEIIAVGRRLTGKPQRPLFVYSVVGDEDV